MGRSSKKELTVAADLVPKPFLEAAALSARKAGDYNAATGRDAYFKLGLASYAQMIDVKAMRLINLAQTRASPNFESVRDTALDVMNYACFLVEAIDAGKIK